MGTVATDSVGGCVFGWRWRESGAPGPTARQWSSSPDQRAAPHCGASVLWDELEAVVRDARQSQDSWRSHDSSD